MTREEAIKKLRAILTEAVEFEDSVCYVTEEDREPLEMAIKALEQESCEDAISRQAALDAVCEIECSMKHKDCILHTGCCFVAQALVDLPPVTQRSETVTEFADRCKECGSRYGKLLKQKLCEDAISRQAVLDGALYTETEEGWSGMTVDVKYIEALPSVTPQPKTGHWILQPSNKEQGERDFIWWKCSKCGQVIYSETEKDRREYHAFCGRCGARMIDPQESEEQE